MRHVCLRRWSLPRDAEGHGETTTCKNCGAKHDHPDDDCWKLEKNKDKRPAWYQKRLDRRAKKNGGTGF